MTDPIGGETPQFSREEVEALLPEWLHGIAGPLAGFEQSKAAQFDALRSPASILGTVLTSALIAQPELGPIVGRALSALLFARTLRDIPQIGHQLKQAFQNKDSEQISRIISDLVPISLAMGPWHRSSRRSDNRSLRPGGKPTTEARASGPGLGREVKSDLSGEDLSKQFNYGYIFSQKVIRPKVETILRESLPSIRRIASDAQIGFRGSVARGYKGPHKNYAPFDPNRFDIDGFIVSDMLAAKIPKSKNGGRFISRKNAPELALLQRQIEEQFEYSGLRTKPFQFRIFSRKEFFKTVSPNAHALINQ